MVLQTEINETFYPKFLHTTLRQRARDLPLSVHTVLTNAQCPPMDGDEVADVLVVSVVLPAELYPALGLLVHLGLVHAVRLAQLPGTLGLLGRQDGEPLLLRSLVLLDLVLHLVVKVSTIFCDNFHNIRKRHILAQQLLVLYELVHECIMGTGTDNTQGRVRADLHILMLLVSQL